MGEVEKPQVLSAAQRNQSQEIERRVRHAVASLVGEGVVPSFYQVAQRARVARSTLYRNGRLRILVEQGRRAARTRVEECASPQSGYLTSELPRFLYGVCPLGEEAVADGGR